MGVWRCQRAHDQSAAFPNNIPLHSTIIDGGKSSMYGNDARNINFHRKKRESKNNKW